MSESPSYSPANETEAQDYVRKAANDRRTVLAIGHDSRRERLRPEVTADLLMSTSRLNQIHWLDPEDRTCEVGAGLSAAELDVVLAEHGLMLGVSGGGLQTGTLGGLFNSGEPSLLAGSCGLPRDQVLGATWLLADGEIIRSGARVVKSVAGYDVTRLFLSAGGQLAICLKLILRLRPRPKDLRWYRLPLEQKRNAADVRAWLDFGINRQRFAAWDGCNCPHGSSERLAADEGEQAWAQARELAEAARQWIAAPRRLALDGSGGLEQENCLLVDYLAHQSAWAAPMPIAQLPQGCAVLPQNQDNPWLEAMRAACTS